MTNSATAAKIHQPAGTIACTVCGHGAFFHVATRRFPTLCLDCADHADRTVNGWTPQNSAD